MSKKIGYIRVSTFGQNPGRQLEGLTLDKVFLEHASGKDIHRPQLALLLDYVRDGDQVFVHSMDRLARNLEDLRSIVLQLNSKKVPIQFLQENLRFNGQDGPLATLLLSIMGAFAEFERALIKERQREGIELAKTRGAYKGRKPVLSQDQRFLLQQQVAAGANKSQLAKELGVSRETLYQYLRKT
jgi:DNA invertase Pin-like site-specific DNA recombinase